MIRCGSRAWTRAPSATEVEGYAEKYGNRVDICSVCRFLERELDRAIDAETKTTADLLWALLQDHWTQEAQRGWVIA